MSVVNSHKIYIDSSQRISGIPANFTIEVKPNLVLSKQTNVWRVSVLNATIPYSFRTVNSSNNTLFVDFNGTQYPCVVAEGNYNILTLLDAVKTAIIQGVSAVRTITLGSSYTRSTGRATISYNTCSVPAVSTLTIYAGSTIAKALGITTNLTINLASSGTGNQNVNVVIYRSLYLRSDSLAQSQNTENILEKSVASDILCEIPLVFNYPAMIVYNGSTETGVYCYNKYISTIQLYLSSTDDYRISLNNLDWNLQLQIDEIALETIERDDLVSQILPPDTAQKINDLEQEKKRIIDELKAERDRIKLSI